jgi:hypothetical protein
MAYPDKGSVGPAANTSSGETRLGLSATAAAAVLYGAVVLFGLGPSSPLALGRNGDFSAPVVQVPHDTAAPGPELRGPQPSPGPARPRPTRQLRGEKSAAQTPVGPKPTVAPELAEQAAAPQPSATTVKQDVQTTLPAPPVAPLPEAEVTITVPPLQIPDPASVLPALPPVPAPLPVPALPAAPKLPLELPG